MKLTIYRETKKKRSFPITTVMQTIGLLYLRLWIYCIFKKDKVGTGDDNRDILACRATAHFLGTNRR